MRIGQTSWHESMLGRRFRGRVPLQLVLIPGAILGLSVPQVNDWLGVPAMIGLGCAGLALALTTRGRYRSWILFAVGYLLATKLRALASTTGIPVRFEYAVFLDRLLPGPEPTVWVQQHMRSDSLDRYALLVYTTYFISPWLFAVVLSWRKPELFRRFVVAFLLTLAMGVVAFFLVPTAPPWMAAQHGDLPGVARLIDSIIGRTPAYSYGQSVAGENQVAAMPSFHMGTIFLMFLASTFRWRWGVLFGIYSASMALSLVYLGEHYVADEIAGCLLASLAWWAAVNSRLQLGDRKEGKPASAFLPGREPAFESSDEG